MGDFRVRSFRVSWSCVCDEKSYNGFNVALCVSGDDPVNNPVKIIYVRPNYRNDGNYSYTFRHNLVQVGNYDVWVQAVSYGKDSFWRSAGGIEIPDDNVGTVGETPTVFRLLSSNPVLVKNSPTPEAPGIFTNIKLSGKKTVGNTTSNYGFITFTGEGDSEVTIASATPYTTAIPQTSVKSNFTARMYDTAEKTTLLDIMEIPVVFRGANGIGGPTVVLSNSSHTIPCNNEGTPLSYLGSNTNLYVYDGATPLEFTTGTLSSGKFTVERTSENITLGSPPTAITTPAKGVYFPNASGMETGVGALTAEIVYTITICSLSGETITTKKTQVFSKSIGGSDGIDGISGYSTGLVHLYQRGASAPVKPTQNINYNILTGVLSNINNGWTQDVPEVNGSPLWVISASVSEQGTAVTISPTSWSQQIKMVQDGVDGLNTNTVHLYKRSLVAPTKPWFVTTYDFVTGLLSGTGLVESGWTQNIPQANGDPLWVTIATASSTATADNINSSEWTTPVIFAQDGVSNTAYFLNLSSYVIKKTEVGVFTPTYVRFACKKRIGNSVPVNYSGIIKLYRNEDVSPFYTSATAETYKDYTVLAGDVLVSAELYSDDGLNLLDSTKCTVISDGATGTGLDAISAILTNESHTIPATNTGMPTSYSGSGTTISIFEGVDKLTYDGIGTANGEYNVTSVATNIAVGAKYTNNGNCSYTDHSGMSSSFDTANIVYTISGKRKNGTAFSIEKTQSFSKSVAGQTGASGVTPSVAVLTNESHSVATDSSGNVSSFSGASTTMSVFLGTVDDSDNWTYSTIKTNVTCSESSTSKTQTITSLTADVGYVDITATKSGQTSITKRFTISKSKQGFSGTNGVNATTYWMTRSASAVKKASSGVFTPASLVFYGKSSTGTNIPVDYAGRFIIATSTDGVNYSNYYTSPSNESAANYTIQSGVTSIRARFFLAGGTSVLLDEEIIPVVSDGDDGDDGTPGSRGAGVFYTTTTSAAWSDTVANNRVTTVTGNSTRIVGDTVTETYGNPISWVLTKVWNGTSWDSPGTVYDGNLFVTESITAASINTSGLTIKNASGIIKTSFDSSGNLQLSGDIVLEGGDVYGKAGKFSALHGSSNQGSASCYCYASDYSSNSQYYGSAALRSAWSDATGEAVGGAASWIVYSALSTGSDYGGIPYASTIRGTVNGSQTIVIGQNSVTMRGEVSHLSGTFQTSGMLKCTRTVSTGSLTDAPMWFSAGYGSLVFDSDANKCISWNDGNSFSIRSGNRAAGGTANVPVAGDGAVKIVMNTDAQNGSCGIYAAPIVTTAGGSPSWTHNIMVSSSAVTIDGGTAWHSGNDGSGSGLDADKLDSMEPSSTNIASTIVTRDASGNFSAGTITATSFSGPLNGTASNATALEGYGSGSFARLGTTSGNAGNFLLLSRTSNYGVLYVNQMGTGSYARFFTGSSDTAASGTNEIILEATGNVKAVSFSGSGVNITSLNASNLSSGTVSIDRIPTGTTSTSVALGNHTHSNYSELTHTHLYAGSASAGGSASSVANTLTLKISGGSTENTNLYTFNGSSGKTLNFIAGTNVSLTAGVGSLTINSTYSYTHPNSGVTAGTYKSVTVNSAGHVTSGTNPTTLSGYGITDAATSSHLHTGTYLPLAGGSMSSGGWITMNGGSIWTANEISCSHSIHPTNGSTTTTCGTSTNKFQAVYATTGTIQTSDARKKTDVCGFTEQELGVAVELSKKIGTFQFLAAVAEKGTDSARKHIGMTVQEAASVFESHGLDPWRYGFMCHDAWGEITNGDGTIPAGDEFSFRPDELLLFIAAGINERLLRLENI